MRAQELAEALGGRRAGAGWLAHCPVPGHGKGRGDVNPSLSIGEDNGKVLVKCMAGCSQADVIAALRRRNLWPGAEPEGSSHRIIATYDYVDAEGRLLFQVVRFEPKGFRQRRPDGKGGWVWNLNGVEPVLYRLPDVLAAVKAGQRVYVCEGEKDADNLRALGFVATTAPMGAGKWRSEYAEALRGAHVVILPDKDAPGRKHAQQVARSMQGVAASVRVLELPGAGKDVSDWLAAGGTREALEAMANRAPEHGKPPDWTPVLVRASEVAPEAATWVWHPYIPRGAVTLLGGDPGIGKTWVALAIARAVSTGGPWPTPNGVEKLPKDRAVAEPATVLYASAEDDIAKTLRPRLEKLDADLTRIVFLPGKRVERPEGDADEAPVYIPDGALEAAIAQVRPALVILDPIQAFLGPGIEMNRAEQVRPLLAHLARLAERYDCAFLLVGHLTKSSRDRAIYRALGSVDFAGAVRSMLLCGVDPNNKERRAVAHVKSNLAKEGPVLGYSIEDDGATGVFLWLGASDLTAAQMLAPDPDPEEETALRQAMDYLEAALADGPVPSREIMKDAKAQGISERTLYRAKERLGIRARKQPGKGGGWEWELEETSDRPPDAPMIHGNLGKLSTDADMTGLGETLPMAILPGREGESGKVAKGGKIAKIANKDCQGSNTTTTMVGDNFAKIANVHHGVVSYYPTRRPDGRCYVCGGQEWRQEPDGRMLCRRCYPK